LTNMQAYDTPPASNTFPQPQPNPYSILSTRTQFRDHTCFDLFLSYLWIRSGLFAFRMYLMKDFMTFHALSGLQVQVRVEYMAQVTLSTGTSLFRPPLPTGPGAGGFASRGGLSLDGESARLATASHLVVSFRSSGGFLKEDIVHFLLRLDVAHRSGTLRELSLAHGGFLYCKPVRV